MNIEQALLATIRELPAERQKEVLDFAAFLAARADQGPAGLRPAGLCAGEFAVTAEFDAPLPDDVLERFTA